MSIGGFIEDNSGPDIIPIYSCKIKGKIINQYDFFYIPDCYSISNLTILSDSGIVINKIAKKLVKDMCKDEISLPRESLHTLLDYKKETDYFFKINENQWGTINSGSGGILYNSIVTGIYQQEPADFVNLPECTGYKLSLAQEQKAEIQSIPQVQNANNSGVLLSISGVGGLIIGLIIGIVFKKLKAKK